MRNITILAMSLLLTSQLWADRPIEPEAEFVGLGRIKAQPDFIQVLFTIQSECYLSPIEAQQGTDLIVKKIDSYLQALKNNNDQYFKVLVDGGYTNSFSRWYNNRELCRNTFQKSTELSLRITASNDFDKIFAAMQSYTLKNFEQDFIGLGDENPRTYVRISVPSLQLTPEHRRDLERQAINLAMLDAKANFRAAMTSCRTHQWKVLRIKEDGFMSYEPPRSSYVAMKMTSNANENVDMAAPIRFDDLKVEKRLSVSFGFDASMCYEP